MLILSDAEIRAVYSGREAMRDAIRTVAEAERAAASGEVAVPPQTHLDYPLGSGSRTYARIQAAVLPAVNAGAARMYTPAGGPAAERELVVVWSHDSLNFEAIMAGGWINVMRTAAATGLATDLLARKDARIVAVMGSGRQARGQLAAVCAVRNVEQAFVFSPTREHREAMAQEMGPELGVDVVAVDDPRRALEMADVVCGATRRPAETAIRGDWVRDGAHVNSIGSHHETDAALALRSRIVVSDRTLLMQEKPARQPFDVLFDSGRLSAADLTELRQVASGQATARESDGQVTLFVSPGSALWDVAVAARALEFARTAGAGTNVPLA